VAWNICPLSYQSTEISTKTSHNFYSTQGSHVLGSLHWLPPVLLSLSRVNLRLSASVVNVTLLTTLHSLVYCLSKRMTDSSWLTFYRGLYFNSENLARE
jgi:hypothetical protein